jgi:tail lysozyme
MAEQGASLLLGGVLVLGGGVLIAAGYTGSSLASVVQGKPDRAKAATAGSSSSSSGSASAAQVNTATGAAAPGAVNTGVASIAKTKGWGASQIAAWLAVIARESGGNLTATNKGSGAYGIAQFIDGPSEYATYGGNATTVTGQLTAMANYIEQRYGTPSAALEHENQYGWY